MKEAQNSNTPLLDTASADTDPDEKSMVTKTFIALLLSKDQVLSLLGVLFLPLDGSIELCHESSHVHILLYRASPDHLQ